MATKLGQLLVSSGVISEKQLEEALKIQRKSDEKLGQILVTMGAVPDEDTVYEYLGKQLNIAYVKPSDIELNPEIVKLIPLDIAKKFNVIAIGKIKKTLIVALSDPRNIYVLDALKFITGYTIQPVICSESSIQKAIDELYQDKGNLEEIIKDLGEDGLEIIESDQELSDEVDLQSMIEDKPLVRLVDSILSEAINKRASDIHIETYEKKVRVRYRIDGELVEVSQIPFKYRAAIVSRVKIMAELDISERRLPQDGRIKVKLRGRAIDLRLSVLPTIYGEKVVMRILDPQSLMVDLTKLGFPEVALKSFSKAISLPYGMILVTGPTGSGKTTTLYSALKTISTPNVNIMTAEDPVEFNFEGINQVLVKSGIGLTFAASLRSFLRQDPDIIMVGEIRDLETAEIAIRAALTGHLVFSTLHTNDAPSTINRLVDMGIPEYLVASGTRLIMAQRMVRKICTRCKEEVENPEELLSHLGLAEEDLRGRRIYRGRGCATCNKSGYSGRTGIFEVMPVSSRIESMIVARAPEQEIREQAIKEGMMTLRVAAVEKLFNGITSIEEVLAATTV
ncbi:MAG: type IV-A pilus assembly ATPase PilB [Candidatus Zixiibacteriota bacterium]|nr:MAG: type IV-A pilus assembly ATPase PilB [candidate division Zixibacteria bacterium]